LSQIVLKFSVVTQGRPAGFSAKQLARPRERAVI